ncbi:hypothetical protein CFII68_02060 [Pseudomonas sp. CFII68]|nr:hypothetical protein CFII68_02060 [Pseudomonas sp. CFII68]
MVLRSLICCFEVIICTADDLKWTRQMLGPITQTSRIDVPLNAAGALTAELSRSIVPALRLQHLMFGDR